MGKPKIVRTAYPKGKFAATEKHLNVKKLEKFEEKVLKTNSNQKRDSSGLREFSVKIQRIPTLSNNINTMQAKCKRNEILKNIESKAHLKHTPETNGDNLVRKSKSKAVENNKNINFKVTSANNTKPFKCISTINNKGAAEVADKSALDVNIFSETQNCCSNKLKTRLNAKGQLKNLMENKAEKYTPKLQKATNTKNTKEVINATPLTSSTIKKCFVKLVRNPNTVNTNKSFADSSNINKRSCVVRLKKLENIESMSSNNYFEVPVIDNNKRNNFRKLSLTKSFRKLVEDEKSEKEIALCHLEKDVEEFRNGSKGAEITEAYTKCNEENQLIRRKISQNNHFSGIQKIAKLSLKRPTEKTNTIITTLQDSKYERQLDSTMVFEPTRNSTLLDLGANKNKQQKKSNEQIKQISSSKDRPLIQNLANKSDEIEKLLNSLDDEEEYLLNSLDKIKENKSIITEKDKSKIEDKQINISTCHNKTNKFFHRNEKIEKILKNNLKSKPAQKRKLVTPQVTKERRFRAKRSSAVRQDNIYEFLSQSQTTDSDIAKKSDPTADIIQKLIQEGKVQVATNCKGKGKPKFKRLRPPAKQIKKIMKDADKNFKILKKESKKVKFVENDNDGADDRLDDNNFDNVHFDNIDLENDDLYTDHGNDKQMQRQDVHSGKNLASEQEGTFSSLARRALINQAGRSELLQAVRNIISTPKNKKLLMPQSALQMDISPIAKPTPRKTAPASPWRVNEDAYLPKTFNFCRSSGNLPSFSSDFIPSTPRKEKSKVYVNDSDQTAISREKSPVKSISSISIIKTPLADNKANNQRKNSNLIESSIISSFSSNDSNAENMPPPRRKPENCNENDTIFDSKQLPNPRRAFKHRSPLKTINILEVVHLPPYKCLNKTKNSEKILAEEETNGLEETLDVSSREGHSIAALDDKKQKDAIINTENHSNESMFGFEDYLSQTDISSQERVEPMDDVLTNERNQTMHDKLHGLRKLKPHENELQKSILTPNSENAIKTIPIFDDDVPKKDGLRQRCIKEMLCSTMLDTQPSTSKGALRRVHNEKLIYKKQSDFGKDLDPSDLFKDPEPETTLNENEAHRTYIRPYKRKRRLKENQFVMFLDSDESGDEDYSPEKQKRQIGREYRSSSPEKAVKKKRPHKATKENAELTEFVEEFNELCKEVESFELVVEKSG